MLILNSWYTAGRSNIYVAGDDGSHFRCLTSRYRLSRYQRLRISPHHSHLLFYAVPYGEETGRFFCWKFGPNRLTIYEQEPYPYDIKWLTNDRLLCIKKGIHWIAYLQDAERTDLGFINGYLVMDVAPDGNRLLLKEGPGIGAVSMSAISSSGDYFWMESQWSPDGGRIAFTRGLEGGGPSAERARVYIQDLQSEEEECIFTLKRSERWRWATDGQSMVHSQGNNGGFSLLRVEIETRRQTELIGPGAGLNDIAELIVV